MGWASQASQASQPEKKEKKSGRCVKMRFDPIFPLAVSKLENRRRKIPRINNAKNFFSCFLENSAPRTKTAHAGIVFLIDVSEADNAAHDVTVCTIEYVV